MNRDEIYLAYIIETIDRLNGLLEQDNIREQYESDWVIQAAMLRCLHTMSETTQRLSDECKASVELPWHDIGDFRNAVVHGYLGDINHEAVWLVLEKHLQPLREWSLRYYETHFGVFELAPKSSEGE